ncbi:archease [Candidatus Nitronereus thalassa]|uniref:Archease n=1 Tax=Candidatus Nitronereus thalassa TaxID=3020898 RepID=A0ABU3K468_9BACT|nr:archease [Candidatus Nitronereus thalassa]MDT7041171.1 archease [Candidatus Nitronereus thalassa]
MSRGFQFIENVAHADMAFDAWGDTPSELFMAAGEALLNLMADPFTVGSQWSHEVRLTQASLDELLFEWLSTLVFLKDAEAVVYHEIKADVEEDLDSHTWHIRGMVFGDQIDGKIQELRSDVKAITKHLYEVHAELGKYQARVVVDV